MGQPFRCASLNCIQLKHRLQARVNFTAFYLEEKYLICRGIVPWHTKHIQVKLAQVGLPQSRVNLTNHVALPVEV